MASDTDPIVITGMGAVSPLGIGVDANWRALMEGKSGIVMNDRFDVTEFAAKIAGLVPKGFDPTTVVDPKDVKKMDLFIQYGMVAAAEALTQSGWVADTPEKMAALGEERVQHLIKTIGLYRTKAKNVVALSKKIAAEHAGEVPRTREALEALPGVGRKTANVVLNVAFGEPTIAVDTHIFRVGNRTGMATGKTPFEVETKLDQVVPAKYKRHAHHWLILHGRYVCVARRPLCERCLVADLCKWPGKAVNQ